jgi:hypothetical protein
MDGRNEASQARSAVMAANNDQSNMQTPSDPKVDFRNLLSKYRYGRSESFISNRYPWQTKMAVLELLKLAESDGKSVRILSGNAPEQFYSEEVIEHIAKCLKAGCDVNILIWSKSRRCPEFESLQKTSYGQNLSFRFSGTTEGSDILQHFLVVGDDAYRLEAIHPDLSGETFTEISPETQAKICFNDPAGGGRLAKLFDTIWDMLVPPSESQIGDQQENLPPADSK